jgi:trimeric autotransporter adhesin
VNPAQQCALTTTPYALNTFLVRIDASGNILESSYLDNLPNVPSGVVQQTTGSSSPGAAVLFWSEYYNTTAIFTLSPASAPIALGCIGNSASFVNMGIAPNEIVSAFGAGIGPAVPTIAQPDANGLYPTQLGGIEITFDGIAAPLLYASSNQVNLITPGALAGKTSTQVCAVLNNVPLNCITATVQAAAPGIFMSGQSYLGMFYNGTPYAAAVNQDGTINSEQNPAAPNSIITLYVTGLGPMTPSPPDGGITPVPEPSQDLQINVVFSADTFDGGLSVFHPKVLYAGPAPREVEGLGQINVQVPDAIQFSISVVSPVGTQQYNSGEAVIWIQSQ